MKKNLLITGIITLVLLFLLLQNWDVITQTGHPFPYLISAIKISESTPYIMVNKNEVITKANDESSLIKDYEEQMKLKFKEQVGSSFIFTDGKKHYTITSEIYLSIYSIWTLPHVAGKQFIGKQ